MGLKTKPQKVLFAQPIESLLVSQNTTNNGIANGFLHESILDLFPKLAASLKKPCIITSLS
jgi:hypothetical protein